MQKTRTAPANLSFGGWGSLATQMLAPEEYSLSEDFPTKLRHGDDGPAKTRGEARATIVNFENHWQESEAFKSKVTGHRDAYRRIHAVDRQVFKDFDNPTTAMMALRLSPSDANDNPLTLCECDEMLNEGWDAVRRAFKRHLKDYTFAWAAVTGPTDNGTPHVHVYFWIDDPNNEVTTDDLDPALGLHLDYCENAEPDGHEYDSDGSSGAITVRHDPVRVDTDHGKQTKGATYVAEHLPYLPLGRLGDDKVRNPTDAELDGAITAWLSGSKSFRHSRGGYF